MAGLVSLIYFIIFIYYSIMVDFTGLRYRDIVCVMVTGRIASCGIRRIWVPAARVTGGGGRKRIGKGQVGMK